MSKSRVRRVYSFEYAWICINSVPASEVVPFSLVFSQWSASQYDQWSQGVDSSLLMGEAVQRSHNLFLAPLKTSAVIRAHTGLLESRDSSCHRFCVLWVSRASWTKASDAVIIHIQEAWPPEITAKPNSPVNFSSFMQFMKGNGRRERFDLFCSQLRP